MVLEPRVSPAFVITYFICNQCNIRFENTSKYVDTLTLFSKNLNQRSLTPTWPLTPCLLRSHVWLYPRIIVSKSHDNTSMYVDTVINFAKYHIHTTYYILCTYYGHTTYRMSDHIVASELSSGETKMDNYNQIEKKKKRKRRRRWRRKNSATKSGSVAECCYCWVFIIMIKHNNQSCPFTTACRGRSRNLKSGWVSASTF